MQVALGRPLGKRLAVVDYLGRRSGDRHQLVAQYVRSDREVHVSVGAADHKTWWRSFLTPDRCEFI